MEYMYFVVAFLGGISVIISRMINAILSQKIGVFQATFYNFLSGLALSLLMFASLFIVGKSTLVGVNFSGFPMIFYFGGFFGLIITALSNLLIPKVSAFYFTLFMFTGQLISGMIFDYILFADFSLGKVIGCTLVVFGLSLNLWVDKKDGEKEKNSIN